MNLGMPEMIFILLLALVIVGPKKLPEVARQLGKFLAEFKRASNEFKHQLEAEMLNIELQERAKKAAGRPASPAAGGAMGAPDAPARRHRQSHAAGAGLRRERRSRHSSAAHSACTQRRTFHIC